MRSRHLEALLAVPAVDDPPARVWRDWVVVAAIVIGSIAEALFRTDDVPWRVPTVLVSGVVAVATLWRRTHPVMSMLVAFGVIGAFSIAVRVATGEVFGFFSIAFVLVIVYAAFRWGSGRQMVASGGIMAASWVIGIATDPGTVGEAIGGLFAISVPAIVGIEVRQVRASRRRAIDDARNAERELLARELHDTVAHHVSAIAVQAQAGRAVAEVNPAAALDALAVIEEEASRTLAEMRTMVAALRDDGSPSAVELAPQRGVADIGRFEGRSADGPDVAVDLSGDLDDLPASLDAALYRIAQESITNASRHAIGATRIDVRVVGEVDGVRLVVTDDGRASSAGGGAADPDAGFGLIGMAERAKLLGGTVTAGPTPRNGSSAGGWTVDASLPRERPRS